MRLALLLGIALASPIASAQLNLSYIGQNQLVTGLPFQGTPVGGLSGLDFDAKTQRFVAISDDRASLAFARYYSLTLDLAQFQRSATPGGAGINLQSVTQIFDGPNLPFAANQVDPEGIRLTSDGKLYWSNEGQRSNAGFQNPTVRLMEPNGAPISALTLPSYYNPSGSVPGTLPADRGVRNNLALESLTLTPDGRTLWTATENALVQDGPFATANGGSPSRMLSFDLASGQAGAEYVYLTEPVALPPQPAGGFATNGLVELLALDAQRFIAVERSFAAGAQTPGTPVTGNTIRLYLVDTKGATNVAGVESLLNQSYQPVSKTLLLDLSTLRNDDGSALALDNIEGISWGPSFNGQRTLILASDNNFSPTQFTQFVALSVAEVPEPAAALLMLPGLALLAARARR
jgi:hypothetical protein